jgi:hypothetical protein
MQEYLICSPLANFSRGETTHVSIEVFFVFTGKRVLLVTV